MNDEVELTENGFAVLSKEAIEKKRIENLRNIERHKVTRRRLILLTIISVSVIFLTSLISNGIWHWAAWIDLLYAVGNLAVVVVTIITTTAAVVFFVSAAAGIVIFAMIGFSISIIMSFTNVDPSAASVGVIATFFVVIITACVGIDVISRVTAKINALKSSLDNLREADNETCLEIQDWLSDETIRSFRDSVLAEKRKFTFQEVNVMKEFWETRPDRQAAEEHASEIERAFQKVYSMASHQYGLI